MTKRALALCLSVILLLGLLPTSAFAAENQASAVYSAAYAAALTADGNTTEGPWLLDGRLSDESRFGVLWNSKYLYVAADAGTLNVTVNGKTASVAADGTVTGIDGAEAAVASALELKIPMAALELNIADYKQTAELTVSNGTGSWSGTLCFNGLVREAADLKYTFELTKKYNVTDTDSENLGGEKVDGGFRMYNRYLEDGIRDYVA